MTVYTIICTFLFSLLLGADILYGLLFIRAVKVSPVKKEQKGSLPFAELNGEIKNFLSYDGSEQS